LITLYSFCSFHAMCRYFNSVQTFELQKFSELIFCQREEAVTFYGCQTAAVILLSRGGSMYNIQQIYRSYESCSVLLKSPAKTTSVRNIMD
jgi:type III secretory pathway component EscT